MGDLDRRLCDLLERERAALLSGDIDTVIGLADEKGRVAADLEGSPPDAAALQALRDRAARNGALLLAALDGMHSAAERLRESRAVQASLTTYDAQGQRRQVAAGPRTGLERKA